MKTYKITATFEHTVTFTVKANNEDEARSIARQQQFILYNEGGDFGSLLSIDDVHNYGYTIKESIEDFKQTYNIAKLIR